MIFETGRGHTSALLERGWNCLEQRVARFILARPAFASILAQRRGLRGGAPLIPAAEGSRCIQYQGPFGMPNFNRQEVSAGLQLDIDIPQMNRKFHFTCEESLPKCFGSDSLSESLKESRRGPGHRTGRQSLHHWPRAWPAILLQNAPIPAKRRREAPRL